MLHFAMKKLLKRLILGNVGSVAFYLHDYVPNLSYKRDIYFTNEQGSHHSCTTVFTIAMISYEIITVNIISIVWETHYG